jgi:hypothetical protein
MTRSCDFEQNHFCPPEQVAVHELGPSHGWWASLITICSAGHAVGSALMRASSDAEQARLVSASSKAMPVWRGGCTGWSLSGLGRRVRGISRRSNSSKREPERDLRGRRRSSCTSARRAGDQGIRIAPPPPPPRTPSIPNPSRRRTRGGAGAAFERTDLRAGSGRAVALAERGPEAQFTTIVGIAQRLRLAEVGHRALFLSGHLLLIRLAWATGRRGE